MQGFTGDMQKSLKISSLSPCCLLVTRMSRGMTLKCQPHDSLSTPVWWLFLPPLGDTLNLITPWSPLLRCLD